MERTDNFSTSSESSILSGKTVKNENKLLKLVQKLNLNFTEGHWVQAKNVTKKGSRIFIKQLNSCTSYHKKEKNHTFTNVLYIPEAGYSIIQFLNAKLASQFIYERQGVNWQDQTDSDSDSESDSEEHEDCQNFKNSQSGQKSEDFKIVEEFEESDGKEEFEENEEIGDENEKKENAKPGFCGCEIEKLELDQDKFVGFLKKNLKKIKSRKKLYYFFAFRDIENAEKYFKEVYFNVENSNFC